MKKLLLVLLFLLVLFIIYFNVKHQKGTYICTYSGENDLYKMHTEYKVKFNRNKVLFLETKEMIESNDKKMLEEYKLHLEMLYSKYNNLKYYDNNIYLNNTILTSLTRIDYNHLNKKEWLKIDKSNKEILDKNNVSFKKLKKIYKDKGANCHYK